MTNNLLSAMEYNYNEYANYVARLPYMHIQQSAEMTLLTSEKIPSWNVVLRTHLSSQNATASIEATLSQFRALNVPLTWHILPSTQPLDLERHLVEHGFFTRGTTARLQLCLLTSVKNGLSNLQTYRFHRAIS